VKDLSIEELNKKFEIRWKTLEKRSKDCNLGLPNKEQLHKLLLVSFFNGFKCDYCKTQLKIYDKYPYYKIFSFEHKKSIYFGGTNNIENFAIVCHRCNLTKGPITEETWRAIIQHLPHELFEKMCNESFSANMSRILKRQKICRDETNNEY